MNFMDIASIRKEYLQGGLRRCQMPDDPLVVFEEWLGEAVEARLVEPTAMVVATVSQECRPSTRTVLLKGLEEGRFVFFTNYESRKGQQIETNPCVSLSFLWYGLERQVHIEGRAVELSAAESDAYFDSRPLGSRIGAIVSPQSRVIGSRTGLMREFVHMRYGLSHGQKQEGDQKANNIPLADSPASQDLRDHPASIDISGLKRPDYWGGYAVTPERIEFWQGRENRLHDRILYTREGDGEWLRQRLAP